MHKTRKSEKNILVAFILNLSFSIYEFVGGAFTNSTAIMSDAIHDLGDAMSIGISYFLERKSKKSPDHNYTYGYARYSLMGGMITTLILLIGSGLVIYNAVLRIINPVPVNYDGMIWLAVVGVIVNYIAARFTRDGDSLNQKSVNLHMLEDVLGWVVVLIGAIVMRFTDISLIDPLLSIAVAIFILKHAWENFWSITNVLLEKTPQGINLTELEKRLQEIDGVDNIHHLHVWSMDGYHNFATLHAVAKNQKTAKIKESIKSALKESGIEHATVEIESSDEKCTEESCEPGELHAHTHTHTHHS